MKRIGIARISIHNPILTSYVRTIQTWGFGTNFEVTNQPFFYGIFLEDQFLGASTIQIEEKTASACITIVNGSIQHYERLEKESIRQLTDIAIKDYDAKTVHVRLVKKLDMIP
ncbi:MAG: hypothetical protein PUB18_04300 [bacterium]|nr:hypothetical protein [bacterium]